MNRIPFPTVAWVVAVLFLVWVVYLLIEVAKHVQAWPFS